MRKIDKTCLLSTTYFDWQKNHKIPHPEYNSSKGKYYKDIVMQLLHCQGGLCAYTEQYLCKTDCYEASHWREGCYQPSKPEFRGQLEHFDSTLKKDTAWSWDNLFLADTDVNTKVKGQKSVDYILKPDDPAYDPNEKLVYNPDLHEFSPHPDLDPATYERVNGMIKTLGLNYGPVVKTRQEYLDQVFKILELTNEVTISQFPTAYYMTRTLKEDNQEDSILEDFL